MPEQQNPEHQLEYLKELRRKYEEALSNAQKSGDYSEATKLKDELNERLIALEALFPKPEAKPESIENEEFDEFEFEIRATEWLKHYLENDLISPKDLLSNLTAMRDKDAIALRGQACIQMVVTSQDISDADQLMLKSYAGVDTKETWRLRDRIMETKDYKEVLISIAGLDSERAWKIRDEVDIRFISHVVLSLTGLDSDRAWDLRDSILNSHPTKNTIYPEILKSIAGLDSERAWELRNSAWKNANSIVTMSFLARSLVGLDSERAWSMRREVYKIATELESIDQSQSLKKSLATSLAGLESNKAWELRDKWHIENRNIELALSLAGLNSDEAWRWRDDLRDQVGIGLLSDTDVISSLNGGFITAIGWRTAKKYQKKEKEG